ncbi:MAG: homoserine kinase [Chloroflexi bacterium]|nr:homoserine kinase [Chloroflexota bacterium]MCY3938465.1 homoserine kinase [Chloroflexota bacterium]
MNRCDQPFAIFAPATSANLGPGFDTLGLALDLYDEYRFEVSETTSVEVTGEAAGETPTGESNLVLNAAIQYSSILGVEFRHRLVRQVSRIPVSRGLGSSAAATVAGIVAACRSAGIEVRRSELIEQATAMEGHPDNVIPALTGGLSVIAQAGSGPVWTKVPFPSDLQIAIAVPETRIETDRARSVLPSEVDFADAIFNVSRAALLVAALQRSDYSVLAEAMRDRLHQPHRSSLHPALSEMIDAAYDSGAVGAALSGSGSAMIAFAESDAEAVGAAMRAACEAAGVSCTSFTTRVCSEGLRVRPE